MRRPGCRVRVVELGRHGGRKRGAKKGSIYGALRNGTGIEVVKLSTSTCKLCKLVPDQMHRPPPSTIYLEHRKGGVWCGAIEAGALDGFTVTL